MSELPVPMSILVVADGTSNTAWLTEALDDVRAERVDASWLDESAVGPSARRFDAVLLDLASGDASALSAVHRARQQCPTAPILVIVDRVDQGLEMLAIAAGATNVINRDQLRGRLMQSKLRHVIEHQQAKDQRDRLTAIFDCAPSFIVALDQTGVIQYINRVRSPLEKRNVVGRYWLDFIDDVHHSMVRENLNDVLQNGAFRRFEMTTGGASPNGVFECHLGPIHAGSGQRGAVIVAEDVTERKVAEAELHAAQRLATIGTLAAGVAHEANTPLQVASDSIHFLKSCSGTLLELVTLLERLHGAVTRGEPVTDVAADCAKALEASDIAYLREQMPAAFDSCGVGIERVASIVRSLREFAAPAARSAARADINRAITNAVMLASSEYNRFADVQLDLESLPEVVCDVGEIHQVILTLLTNAAHAIEDASRAGGGKGRICIRTKRDGRHVLISVSDTGVGIPSEIQHRIFDPFFTTKDVGRGSGQGLALAKVIIEKKHKGSLRCESTLGVGSVFSVRLPIGEEHDAALGFSFTV